MMMCMMIMEKRLAMNRRQFVISRKEWRMRCEVWDYTAVFLNCLNTSPLLCISNLKFKYLYINRKYYIQGELFFSEKFWFPSYFIIICPIVISTWILIHFYLKRETEIIGSINPAICHSSRCCMGTL